MDVQRISGADIIPEGFSPSSETREEPPREEPSRPEPTVRVSGEEKGANINTYA